MRGKIEKVVLGAVYDCVHVTSDGKLTQFAFNAGTVKAEDAGKNVELTKAEGKDWVIRVVETKAEPKTENK